MQSAITPVPCYRKKWNKNHLMLDWNWRWNQCLEWILNDEENEIQCFVSVC